MFDDEDLKQGLGQLVARVLETSWSVRLQFVVQSYGADTRSDTTQEAPGGIIFHLFERVFGRVDRMFKV